jgi:6,7-dimethyl-8-ribityllumazine synthase
MATIYKPAYNEVPSGAGKSFGIVVSEWNPDITEALLDAACSTLLKYGVKEKDIHVKRVPGSFELTLGAQFFAEYTEVDGVICLGCVIQGDTPHFTYVCQGVTHGITELNLEYNIPFVFGVITTNTFEQAKDRAGGKLGNKGEESAIVALKMAALQDEMSK